jgi:hypothetical protein
MIVFPQPSCHNRLKSLNSFSVSLLGGGAGGIGGLPVPGEEFGDAFGRVVGDPREDVRLDQ